MSKISKVDANRFLSNVSEENKFWCKDGNQFNNLNDLRLALANMDDSTFSHHVNEEKNDFYNWIAQAVGDKELAGKIKKASQKKDVLAKLEQRFAKLSKL